MLNRMVVLKDLATKVGKKNASELWHLIEGKEPFVVEVKIISKDVNEKCERIKIRDNQEVVLQYSKE